MEDAVRCGCVLPTDYEVVGRDRLRHFDVHSDLPSDPDSSTEVAVLHCFNERNERFTAVGRPSDLAVLLSGEKIRDPDGIKLTHLKGWLVLKGWLQPECN